MLCHPEPHPAVNYALRNVKSPLSFEDFLHAIAQVLIHLAPVHPALLGDLVGDTLHSAGNVVG